MAYEMKIIAENPADLARNIAGLFAVFGGAPQPQTTPAAPAEQPKPRSRKKADDPPAEQPAAETQPDPAQIDIEDAIAASKADTSDEKPAETAEAPPKGRSRDELRAYLLEYLNTCFDKMEARKTERDRIFTKFGVENILSTPDDKLRALEGEIEEAYLARAKAK